MKNLIILILSSLLFTSITIAQTKEKFDYNYSSARLFFKLKPELRDSTRVFPKIKGMTSGYTFDDEWFAYSLDSICEKSMSPRLFDFSKANKLIFFIKYDSSGYPHDVSFTASPGTGIEEVKKVEDDIWILHNNLMNFRIDTTKVRLHYYRQDSVSTFRFTVSNQVVPVIPKRK